jgi:hypothetical protein
MVFMDVPSSLIQYSAWEQLGFAAIVVCAVGAFLELVQALAVKSRSGAIQGSHTGSRPGRHAPAAKAEALQGHAGAAGRCFTPR